MLQSLDRLKVFHYVYSEQSVLAAAEILHVSQSAVSQALRKLEKEIKSPLFTRLHKRLVPTLAGDRLYEVVQPFMADLEVCLKTLEQSKDQPFGELRIGAPSEFGKAYFPAIIAAFREEYPEVTFYLKLGDAATLLPMVESGQIELALVDEYLTQNQFFGKLDIFHFRPVVAEEVILASSKQYYEKFIRKDHSFKNLIQQNFIAYRRSAQTVRNWFKHHFGKYNGDVNVALTVGSHQGVIAAIRHHVGLGVIASHMVGESIESGDILRIDTSKEEIINQMSLVQLQNKIPLRAEKMFEKFLVEKIKSMKI